MPRQVELRLPALPAAEVIAQTVALSYAHACGWSAAVAGDLGLVCQLVWWELLAAPSVTEVRWRLYAADGSLRMGIEGRPGEEPGGATAAWLTPAIAQIIERLAARASVIGSGQVLISLEVDQPQ